MKEKQSNYKECPLACHAPNALGINDYQGDEIDLWELFFSLWQQRLVIVVSSSLLFFIGVVVLFSLPKVYESNCKLMRPSNSYIALANQSLYAHLSPSAIFQKFYESLQSKDLWMEHRRAVTETFDRKEESEKFEKTLTVEIVEPKSKKDESVNPKVIEVAYTSNTGEAASQELQAYVDFLKQRVIDQLSENFEKHHAQQVALLQKQLDKLKMKAKLEFNSQLKVLSVENENAILALEAKIAKVKAETIAAHRYKLKGYEDNLLLAKNLGLKAPTSMTSFTERSVSENKAAVVSVSGNAPPLYLFGTDFINTRINLLREKNEEDIYGAAIVSLVEEVNLLKKKINIEAHKKKQGEEFIAGIPEFRTKLNFSENIDVDWDKIKVFNVISSIPQEGKKIKSKTVLSLVFIALFSLMVGLCVAFIFMFVKKNSGLK